MDIPSLYKKLEDFTITLVNQIVNKRLKDSYLVSRKAVIVYDYNSTDNTVSVIIPTDQNTPTIYYYPNRTGQTLNKGQKVYLTYQTGNISQGWIEINKSLDDLTLNNLTINNNAVIQGNLNVNGNANLNSLNVVNETVSGTINKQDGANLYPYVYFTEEEDW